MAPKNPKRHSPRDLERNWTPEEALMIELKYSLVIEATEDPNFFAFYSPDLEGFTGVGDSIEKCLNEAKLGMGEHLAVLRELNLPIPKENPKPIITIQNSEQTASAA